MMDDMRKQDVEIAVLIATYNGAEYLESLLESLIQQTYQNFICYIHDDGSEDETIQIIYKYKKRHKEKIEVVEGDKTGSSKDNFLYLLRKVHAQYYMFCDQDDVWMPDKIEKSLGRIKVIEGNMAKCVYTDLKVVDERLNLIDKSFYHYTELDPSKNSYKNLLMSNVCVGCTIIINDQLKKLMLQQVFENIPMHDWLAALLSSACGRLAFLDEPTVLYRQHQTNVLGATKELPVLQKIVRDINIKQFIKRNRFYVNRPRKMAEDLLKIRIPNNEKLIFLEKFADVAKQNKIQRILFYKNNSLYRQRINKIWQLLFV